MVTHDAATSCEALTSISSQAGADRRTPHALLRAPYHCPVGAARVTTIEASPSPNCGPGGADFANCGTGDSDCAICGHGCTDSAHCSHDCTNFATGGHVGTDLAHCGPGGTDFASLDNITEASPSPNWTEICARRTFDSEL